MGKFIFREFYNFILGKTEKKGKRLWIRKIARIIQHIYKQKSKIIQIITTKKIYFELISLL